MNLLLRIGGRRLSRLLEVVARLLAGLVLVAGAVWAAAPLPAKPETYVEDRAGMLDAGTAQSLRLALEQFERETSNQLLVATFPRVPEGEAMEDFTQRTAQAWGAGQADRDNGAVLFVFRDDRKMRIEVGYGLEGAIPDTIAARIIANEIRPRFRANDFAGGIEAGMRALMAAAKGEYTGTGRTVAERPSSGGSLAGWLIFFLVLYFIFHLWAARRDTEYDSRGRRRVWGPVSTTDWPGRTWGGGTWGGGGGWSSGGGGGFGGGGGSFGGGGASGDW
jgi:uncharacterized protein